MNKFTLFVTFMVLVFQTIVPFATPSITKKDQTPDFLQELDNANRKLGDDYIVGYDYDYDYKYGYDYDYDYHVGCEEKTCWEVCSCKGDDYDDYTKNYDYDYGSKGSKSGSKGPKGGGSKGSKRRSRNLNGLRNVEI